MAHEKGKHRHDWSGRKESKPMKYETAAKMVFINAGQAYAEGWDRVFGEKKDKEGEP
jgi:hypothetical protein